MFKIFNINDFVRSSSITSYRGYEVEADVVTSGTVFIYAGIAILGAITYLCWYKAVDLIGAAMGTALNSTAALWSIVFSTLLFGNKITPSLGFWGVVIVSGIFIFAISPKPEN